MSTLTEPMRSDTQSYAPAGGIKFLKDVGTIFEIKFLFFLRAWYWYVIGSLVFPIGMFYFARALAPDTEEAIRRAMTGTIIFGASMLTTNMLAQQLIQDRFLGRLKLIITMPVSRGAYAFGILVFGSMLTASTVAVLLAVAMTAGVSFSITWVFVPTVVAVLLALAGITLWIASYAPSAEVGSVMSNLLGILLTFISPVYFPAEQAPFIMRMFGWVSPFRYAADAMMKSFSGQTDVWAEKAILAAFALASMSLGVWRLRWREE
jgi:ABC-type multidrug transport system permease subunit